MPAAIICYPRIFRDMYIDIFRTVWLLVFSNLNNPIVLQLSRFNSEFIGIFSNIHRIYCFPYIVDFKSVMNKFVTRIIICGIFVAPVRFTITRYYSITCIRGYGVLLFIPMSSIFHLCFSPHACLILNSA